MINNKLIRVMIIEDHEMVRTGISVFLQSEPDLELVGEAGNGEMGVLLASQIVPDVILMDINMPGMNGVEATKRIIEFNPSIKIIALTSFIDDYMVLDMLNAGAVSFILKNSTTEDLASTIRSAALGRSVIVSEAAQALIRIKSVNKPEYYLSNRETEVLKVLAQGLTNKEVAEVLGVAETTIKTHVRKILLKLNAKNRVDAIRIAREGGIVID